MRELLTMFGSFFKIGLFTFGGGYAMVPIIQREVIDHRGWVDRDEFVELLTLAQSAPGPIALNTSVFVGYKMRGYAGALAALLGVVVPAFTVILIVAIYFAQFRENVYVNAAFKGMRPAVVALIVSPIVSLSRGMGAWKYVLAAAVALFVWWSGVSPIWLIVVAAVVGVAIELFNSRKHVER
ncbi:MAG: chromate transporter [Rikenellaceae bacterium]|jgi:chromate transporter|nr:chromate transporter [Rikenellaceae bacterium]MBQ5678361.1 chromate transporter [Rikenellaceae bacterium]MBQ5853529.1 chromate transporter [Rikenellaceae bacterium]MBQ5894807.1 chromate transporter [Rikenellaceae bacterium]